MASRVPSPLSGIVKSRIAVPLVSFLVLLYVIVPNVGSFSASSTIIRQAKPIPVIAATTAVIGTYAAAAGVYQSLSLKRLSFNRTLLVQSATAFTNRTLPSGFGGMALIAAYLRFEGYSLSEAAALVAVNGTIGVIGHLLLLGTILSVGAADVALDRQAVPGMVWLVAAAGMAIGAAVLILSGTVRRKVLRFAHGFVRQLVAYRHTPFRLASALFMSIGLTFGSVLALYLCVVAVGADVTLWQSFVAFTVGAAVGSVTPTPGGLGGVEAGLVAGLMAFGSEASTALAAVLLFRFITFWLLLLPGFAAFLRIRNVYRQSS